jgi:hypothetical protein
MHSGKILSSQRKNRAALSQPRQRIEDEGKLLVTKRCAEHKFDFGCVFLLC